MPNPEKDKTPKKKTVSEELLSGIWDNNAPTETAVKPKPVNGKPVAETKTVSSQLLDGIFDDNGQIKKKVSKNESDVSSTEDQVSPSVSGNTESISGQPTKPQPNSVFSLLGKGLNYIQGNLVNPVATALSDVEQKVKDKILQSPELLSKFKKDVQTHYDDKIGKETSYAGGQYNLSNVPVVSDRGRELVKERDNYLKELDDNAAILVGGLTPVETKYLDENGKTKYKTEYVKNETVLPIDYKPLDPKPDINIEISKMGNIGKELMKITNPTQAEQLDANATPYLQQQAQYMGIAARAKYLDAELLKKGKGIVNDPIKYKAFTDYAEGKATSEQIDFLAKSGVKQLWDERNGLANLSNEITHVNPALREGELKKAIFNRLTNLYGTNQGGLLRFGTQGWSAEQLNKVVNDFKQKLTDPRDVSLLDNIAEQKELGMLIGDNQSWAAKMREQFFGSIFNTGKYISDDLLGVDIPNILNPVNADNRNKEQQLRELKQSDADKSNVTTSFLPDKKQFSLKQYVDVNTDSPTFMQTVENKGEMDGSFADKVLYNSAAQFGQLAAQAVVAKTLPTFGKVGATGFVENKAANFITKVAMPAYAMTYDGNYKQSFDVVGTKDVWKNNLYATLTSGFEGATELLGNPLEQTKILTSLFKKDIGTFVKNLSWDAIQKMGKEEFTEKLKNVGINVLKAAGRGGAAQIGEANEEWVNSVATGTTQLIFNPDYTTGANILQQAGQTWLQTLASMGFMQVGTVTAARSGWGGKLPQDAITFLAQNKEAAIENANQQVVDKVITQKEANEKIHLINTAALAHEQSRNAATVQAVTTGKKISKSNLAALTMARANEIEIDNQISEAKKTNDVALEVTLEDKKNQYVEIRKSLINDEMWIDPITGTPEVPPIAETPEPQQASQDELQSNEPVTVPKIKAVKGQNEEQAKAFDTHKTEVNNWLENKNIRLRNLFGKIPFKDFKKEYDTVKDTYLKKIGEAVTLSQTKTESDGKNNEAKGNEETQRQNEVLTQTAEGTTENLVPSDLKNESEQAKEQAPASTVVGKVDDVKTKEQKFIERADKTLPEKTKKVRDLGWNPKTGKKEGSKYELTRLYLSQLTSDKFESKLEEIDAELANKEQSIPSSNKFETVGKAEQQPSTVKSEEVKGIAEHAQNIKNKFRETFKAKGNTDEHIDGALALMDARAKSWASEEKGRTPDEWYNRIIDVRSGEFVSDDIQYQFFPKPIKKVAKWAAILSTVWNLNAKIPNKLFQYKGDTETVSILKSLSSLDMVYLDKEGKVKKEASKIPSINDSAASYVVNLWAKSGYPKISIEKGDGRSYYNPIKNEIILKLSIKQADSVVPEINDNGEVTGYGISSGLVFAELSHALQAAKGDLSVGRAISDFLKSNGDYEKTYNKKGTVENDAHSIIQKDLVEGFNKTLKFQNQEGITKGALETLKDGRVVIHALEKPDFSTMVHEIGHIFEKDLTAAEQKIVKDFGGSEPFARAFERYLRDGKAPTEQLKTIFDKFKEWLTDIYKSLKGSAIEKKVSPEIKQIFDRLLTEKSKSENKPIQNEQAKASVVGDKPSMGDENLQLQKQSDTVENILGLSSEDADAVSIIYNADLTPTEKKILYRQYKNGVMNLTDVKNYAGVIDLNKLNSEDIGKWARAALGKSKNKSGKFNAEDIDFEEIPNTKSNENKAQEAKEPIKQGVEGSAAVNEPVAAKTGKPSTTEVNKIERPTSETEKVNTPSSTVYYQGIPKTTSFMQGLIDGDGNELIQGSVSDVERFKKENGIKEESVQYVDLDTSNPNSLINKFLNHAKTNIPENTQGTEQNKIGGQNAIQKQTAAESVLRNEGIRGESGLSEVEQNDKSKKPSEESTQQKEIAQKGKELADKIRSLRPKKGGNAQATIFALPIAIYDTAIVTIANAVELTGDLAQAINEGVKYIQSQVSDWKDKDGKFEQHINDFVEGKKPKITAQTTDEDVAKPKEETDKKKESNEKRANTNELNKLATDIVGIDEVKKYLSGKTIEKHTGEKPTNPQEYISTDLQKAFEQGENIIDKAKALFGDKYVPELLDYLNRANISIAAKSLVYVSLANDLYKEKKAFPDRFEEITKLQFMVNRDAQAFAHDVSVALGLRRLQNLQLYGADTSNIADSILTPVEQEQKMELEDAVQVDDKEVNNEFEQQENNEEDVTETAETAKDVEQDKKDKKSKKDTRKKTPKSQWKAVTIDADALKQKMDEIKNKINKLDC